MTELSKTMVFVAVAIVSMIAALVTRPTSTELDVRSLVGENLTKKFSDPDAAKQLRIVRFNEDTATLREFEVAESDGLWTIPSKSGYPADAERQMAEAATCLMDREVLGVASENAADHEQFGVIDPLSPKLSAGQKGVGTRVVMADIRGEPLVDLIIGRKVKDSDTQRYVREAARDLVYVVEIDPEKLSTNFENWIEQDLLKINPWDLRQVDIKDYSASLEPVLTNQGLAIQVSWDPRAEMTLAYDDQQAQWTATRLREFQPDKKDYADFQLGDDEELNTEKLDGLKTALDDLRIVDVVRKPAGLSGDLKAGGDFLNNPEARQDLRSRGFAALPARNGRGQEIISTDGEVICTMRNGAEYVLRFGDLQLTDGESASGETASADGKDGESVSASKEKAASKEGVHRYLFVMARFNEDAVAKPQLEKLPELPGDSKDVAGEIEDSAGESITGDAASVGVEEVKPDDESASENADEDEGDSDGASASADGDQTQSDEALAKAIAERKRIEEENQRKLEEYQDTLKQGREAVQSLNARFGDWYYVVANDVFQKIRLGRDDVIQKKEKKDAAAGESASASGNTSDFGAPGQQVPGLPPIPATGS